MPRLVPMAVLLLEALADGEVAGVAGEGGRLGAFDWTLGADVTGLEDGVAAATVPSTAEEEATADAATALDGELEAISLDGGLEAVGGADADEIGAA